VEFRNNIEIISDMFLKYCEKFWNFGILRVFTANILAAFITRLCDLERGKGKCSPAEFT
jgi:hypothetical protein